MPRISTLLAALAVAGLVLAGVVAAGGAADLDLPALPNATNTDAVETPDEATVLSFETTGPTCADPRHSNTSTSTTPMGDGTKVRLVTNVTVPSRSAAVDADLVDVGPRRYHFDVTPRDPSGTADCHLEARYNATLFFPADERTTLVVTHARRLETVVFDDPGHSGAAGYASVPSDARAGGSTREASSDGNATATTGVGGTAADG